LALELEIYEHEAHEEMQIPWLRLSEKDTARSNNDGVDDNPFSL
jgi:hypothetical protein